MVRDMSKAYRNLGDLIYKVLPLAGFDFAKGVGVIKLCGYDSDVLIKYKLLRSKRTGEFAYKVLSVTNQPRLFSPSIPFASERDRLLWHLHKTKGIPLPLRLERAIRGEGSLVEIFRYPEGRLVVRYEVKDGVYTITGYKLVKEKTQTA